MRLLVGLGGSHFRGNYLGCSEYEGEPVTAYGTKCSYAFVASTRLAAMGVNLPVRMIDYQSEIRLKAHKKL